MKTLRVCLSSELPEISNRDPDFIYFLYDKLIVFIGQNQYYDPYAIVETMPTYPVNNMIYFVLDGYVKTYIDYKVVDIGQIENQEQLELLKQAGSTFFVYADKRYLDYRTKTITLPYNNGTYELTVSLANDIKIDEDTTIKFNPETNQFDIVGNIQDFNMIFTRDYEGRETKSVETKVSEHKISSNLKVSKAYDNIIKLLDDGIYADTNTKVPVKEFESWVSSFREYKNSMEYYLDSLEKEIEASVGTVSESSISSKIKDALDNAYSDIDEAINAYDELLKKIDNDKAEVIAYTDKRFDTATEELTNLIIDSTENPWEDFNEKVEASENVE